MQIICKKISNKSVIYMNFFSIFFKFGKKNISLNQKKLKQKITVTGVTNKKCSYL